MAKTVEELQSELSLFQQDGATNLYYALNKKMNEMAKLLNNNNLATMTIDDPKDKTFDRLKIVWQDAADIAQAVKALGDIAGVTGNEEQDMKKQIPISAKAIANGDI